MDTLAALVRNFASAPTFEVAADLALRAALQIAERALASSGYAGNGRILRAMVHLRPDDGYVRLVALEAGWCVTEFGRQPWIVHGAMRTRDAVTPFPHLVAPFWIFTIVYALLGVAVVFLLFRQLRSAEGSATGVDHGH